MPETYNCPVRIPSGRLSTRNGDDALLNDFDREERLAYGCGASAIQVEMGFPQRQLHVD
jgi:hypothetical protein